jgi:hypothetical protein
MRLRHSWIVLLLGGLLVMLVGSASPSGAAACKADDFIVLLTGLTPGDPVDLSQPSSITATVTAVSKACGNAVDTSYKSAILSASGTSANGTFVDGTIEQPGAAGIGNVNLKFKQGIATAVVTPSSDALGVRLTATDGNDPSLFEEKSAPFDVFDKVCTEGEECTSEIGDTKGSGGTQVTVDLPDGLTGFTGLSLGNSTGATCPDAPPDVAPFGQAYVIAPPSDENLGEYTATVRFAKKLVNGIGNPHFVHCMATPDSTSGQTVLDYAVVPLCPNQEPTGHAKCILDQHKNNAGELVVTFLLKAGDPGGIGFG